MIRESQVPDGLRPIKQEKDTREEQGRRLLAHLRLGKSGVRSSHELSVLAGIRQRSVGFVVSDLRRGGTLVGSAHGEGYYLISNERELHDTMDHIEARKRGIDMTLDALRNAWDQR